MNPLETVKVLLDAALQGREPGPETIHELEARDDLPAEVAKIVHALHHFVDDQDIRERQAEYREYWRRRLSELRRGL